VQVSFSKRFLIESLILVAIIVAGVWYLFWRPSDNDSNLFPCGTCLVTECTVYDSFSSLREYPSSIVKLSDQEGSERYQIGDVIVDKSQREINFPGSISQDSQPVRFLLSPQPPGLQISCLIMAEAKLIDLQNGIALLDWKHWEQLRTTNEAPLELLVQWQENDDIKQVKAAEIVKERRLDLVDLMFVGTEFQWQELALTQAGVPSACPIVLLQEEQPQVACEVSSSLLPPSGTKVTLILRVTGK